MNLLHLASHFVSDRAQAVLVDVVAAFGLVFIVGAAVVVVLWFFNVV